MVKKNAAEKHERITDSLLGPWEKASIRWLMERMPDWVMPDHLTFIGFVGSLLVFIGYFLTTRSPHFLWLASFGVIVNWFGDSTDGNLARYRHTERPKYGFFLDHSVDVISIMLVFLGLGLSPYMHLNLALLGLVGYLLSTLFVFLDTVVNGVFQISFGKLGPTEGRAIIVLVNLFMFVVGSPSWRFPYLGELSLYDLIMIGVIGVLYGIYLVMVSKRLNMLAKLEPARPYHREKEAPGGEPVKGPAK